MVTLVVLDARASDFIDKNKIHVPLFNTEQEFLNELGSYLERHYDAIISDAEPDGYIAALLYALHHGMSSLPYQCFRVALTQESVDIFAAHKQYSILALDWFPLYGTNTQLFDTVTLLNPSCSGLFANTSISDIILRALQRPTPFMKDLAATAIITKEAVSSTNTTLVSTILAHPTLFSTLHHHVREGTLNRTNIHQSLFSDLAAYMSAPYLLRGEEGIHTFVRLVLAHPAFTYDDLFNFTHHPAVKFLRRCAHQVATQLNTEKELFNSQKEQRGNVLLFEPTHTNPGFIQHFLEILSAEHLGKIIMLRQPINGYTKYSIAHQGLLVDLGNILERLGAGGGHASSAGALVKDAELFEKQFIEAVQQETL